MALSDEASTDLARSTGIVTLLFSDIEGSTAMEVALGTQAYGQVRERHRSLIRAALGARGGEEQGTEGDSFFWLFPSALDAVRGAVDAQRALIAEPWPEGRPVRVRMGLHSGEAFRYGGDLVGYAINRAARVTAAAHGGQVIVSSATHALVVDELPAGLSLRDLGQHRLKDLRLPEHLFQVIADGLPADLPPPRSLDARPNNLPTQLTAFVGREREVADALQHLSTVRLLTLTGPGGTGKTRLGLQVAAMAADDYPDGVWFVALEPVRESSLVAPAIARAMDIVDASDRSALASIVDRIGDRHVLILLDNFEQVLEGATVVAQLLQGCPGLTVMVTSRAPLHIAGEQEWPIPGLPVPMVDDGSSPIALLGRPASSAAAEVAEIAGFESVQLFVSRARAVRPDFMLTDQNALAVARICARLRGMPLAIELCAARVKLLSPERILERLEDQLSLLAAGGRDVPERQRTLRGAIAWSYDLLHPGSQTLMDQLSVFVGGMELELVEAVVELEASSDLLDDLSRLVDQSLLRVDEVAGEPRFGMLDTIREYAGERLAAAGRSETTSRRHAAAYLDLAERAAPHLSGSAQRRWLDRLEREHGNLGAALSGMLDRGETESAVRLSFALWRFWQQRGFLNEAADRLAAVQMAVDAGPDIPARRRAELAEARGGVDYWRGEYDAATTAYVLSLDMWRQTADRAATANALYNLGYMGVGRLLAGLELDGSEVAGKAMLEEATATFRSLGDRAGEGNVLWALGLLAFSDRDFPAAERLLRESLDIQVTVGNRSMEAWSRHLLALTLLGRGAIDEAIAMAVIALRAFHAASDVAGINLVLDDISLGLLGTGDRVGSGRLWGAARRIQTTTGTGIAQSNAVFSRRSGIPDPAEALTPEEYQRYTAEGAAMSLDEVVAYALRSCGVPVEVAGPQ